LKNKINLILSILMIIGLFVITADKIVSAQLIVQKAGMPTARWDLASCAVNGIIYAIGGWGGGSTLSSVEAYDPGTNTWTKKADMPTARGGLSACEINGIIYVIGGWSSSNSSIVSTVEAYDPSTNTWTKKADMPTARNYPIANAVNGIIYVIGGWAYSPAVTVEAYEPATNIWVKKADMPTGRYASSHSVVNGSIYVMGGMISGTGDSTNAVEVYDPSIDRWMKKGDMSFYNLWSAACVLGNQIYSIEGFGGASNIMVYDPVTDVWKPMTNTYPVRNSHTASVVNGKIYVIGGSINSGANEPTNLVSEYDPFRAPKRPQMVDTKGKLAILWGGIKVNN
jgi:N-acetylneuraminic acid mutarotase